MDKSDKSSEGSTKVSFSDGATDVEEAAPVVGRRPTDEKLKLSANQRLSIHSKAWDIDGDGE